MAAELDLKEQSLKNTQLSGQNQQLVEELGVLEEELLRNKRLIRTQEEARQETQLGKSGMAASRRHSHQDRLEPVRREGSPVNQLRSSNKNSDKWEGDSFMEGRSQVMQMQLSRSKRHIPPAS